MDGRRRGDGAIIEAEERQCRGEEREAQEEIETAVLFLSLFSCSKYRAGRQVKWAAGEWE